MLEENPPQSPNVCTSWRKLLTNLPDCDLKHDVAEWVIATLKNYPKAFREAFGSLPKDFRNSKPQPLAQTQADQGAGDQGIQGIREKRAGALRAVAEKGKTNGNPIPNVDSQLIRKAREVIQDGPREANTDYLIDALQDVCRQELHRSVTRAQARVALDQSQRGQTA